MQRRLTIALIATALVSIMLVGFGVLAMAQLSARSDAEDQVTRGLNVITGFDFRATRLGDVERQLLRVRGEFGFDQFGVVMVDDDGSLLSVRGRAGPRTAGLIDLPELSLDGGQMEALAADETVLVSIDGSVVGLRGFSSPFAEGRQLALLANRSVSAVSGRTVTWFVTSSALVLASALVAGLVLARRLTGPIKDIQEATAAIAGGDLTARVDVHGTDEVADLGNEVNRMAGDLERSRALDRQFLMSVSHDLKTPLTAISGYAEGLRDGAIDDHAAAGEIIGNHAARLERLVGDLLDLARLDANRFTLNQRQFDLSVVTGRTVAGLARRASDNGIRLMAAPTEAVTVFGDPDRTAQAIANLIDNAIKFAASTILVEVTADGPWAVVAVADDGPGIAPADLDHIFDRLYTGKAQPERAENPTGLGLAIVRELAHAMGGAVSAANNEPGSGAGDATGTGDGARLSLALPRHQAEGSPAPEDPASGASINGMAVQRPQPTEPGPRDRPPAESPGPQPPVSGKPAQ